MTNGREECVRKYYHIARTVNDGFGILENGLRCDADGYIYLLTRYEISDYVAWNQLLIYTDYPVIQISPKGITGVIEPDNVAEITAKYQVRVRQQIIKPDYLKLKCVKKTGGHCEDSDLCESE